jgi:alpha-mannosidase
MTLRRASIMLPCQKLDHFPRHLAGQEALELLAAWTTLWHPALIHATGRLPGWHPADTPPDPATLTGELVLVPSVSRQHLAGDWLQRVRETGPTNPPPVEAVASRDATIAAALAAATIAPDSVAPDLAADFLALGFAHLQVELLTRAMRYSTVLDDEQFTNAVVTAARAAISGDDKLTADELGRAFDLLADARNHVYAVDFYVVDVTLVANSTLGEALRSRLASDVPTSLLVTGELMEKIAHEHPDTLAELKRALAAGTVCVGGGYFHGGANEWAAPETVLRELEWGRNAAREWLGREYEVFAQFEAAFSPLLPEILAGRGFTAALHASFDGGRLPRANQCKTRWGERGGAWLEALSAVPLDASRPETWLQFAERVGDSIAHDHVATVVLASWPGQQCEYHQDLYRAARYNPVLGKLVTLEEYFRVTRETDDWTTFTPREYPSQTGLKPVANPISTAVRAYRRDVADVYARLTRGLSRVANSIGNSAAADGSNSSAALNPWNFASPRFIGVDPADFTSDDGTATQQASYLPDVPGCGYALPDSGSVVSDVNIVDGRILRNELLELTVSETTGGIQSLRTHRDRSTRVSQRLVYYRARSGRHVRRAQDAEPPKLDTQMVAEDIRVVRNDTDLGEIKSQGRLLDLAGQLLARFTQSVRVVRGLPAAIVDVELQPEVLPEGNLWASYFASRLAWVDEAVSFRCGAQWLSRETGRERIESPEWVEFSSGAGNIVCFGMGLPYHRRAGMTWLDTLLCVAGEEGRRFQFALGLDCAYPTQTALSLLTAGSRERGTLACQLHQPRGWFLHQGAKSLIMTHVEPLEGERSGIRCRVLETQGRGVETSLAAFRPFRSAQITDFRGTAGEVLSIVDGAVRFEIGAHRWIQIEAEW